MLILIGLGKPFLLARARRGAKPDNPDNLAIAGPTGPKPGHLLKPDISDAIDVFDPVPHKMSRRATSGPDLKTSFSRSNPRMRGQATSTRTAIRRGKALEQPPILEAPGFPVRINLLFTM